MPTVRDIMDPDPIVVSPDASFDDVVQAMRSSERNGVLVVDAEDRCVGIITESDLIIGDEEGELHLPHFIELFGGVIYLEPLSRFHDRIRKAVAANARQLMTRDPVTVDAGNSPQEAARKIVRSGHNRLPVVENGRLVGVVTRADALEFLAHDDE